MKPVIALVQGDAAGIGPELMAKLLTLDEVQNAADILVISDPDIFISGCMLARVSHDLPVISDPDRADFSGGQPNLLDVTQCLDVPALDLSGIALGEVSTKAGKAVLEAFGLALDLCKAGTVDGLCFMPFNKQAMHQAGLGTEDELQWAKARLDFHGRASEFNVIDGMWNARVTSHIPLRQVADRLSIDGIVASIELAHQTLQDAGFARPKIAVAALNPHAGDGGAIGREEIEIIRPAVEIAKKRQIACDGPFPSDTLYIKVRDGLYDCAVSMYHDQGQIAIKLLGFEMGVSVHGGLPMPMTTPAHGTAFDIAGTNAANVEPARRAVLMAAQMATNRSVANSRGAIELKQGR